MVMRRQFDAAVTDMISLMASDYELVYAILRRVSYTTPAPR